MKYRASLKGDTLFIYLGNREQGGESAVQPEHIMAAFRTLEGSPSDSRIIDGKPVFQFGETLVTLSGNDLLIRKDRISSFEDIICIKVNPNATEDMEALRAIVDNAKRDLLTETESTGTDGEAPPTDET